MGMDIPTILSELKARGWKQSELAARIGVWQGRISEMAAGKFDPKLSVAIRLQQLHASGEVPEREKAAA